MVDHIMVSMHRLPEHPLKEEVLQMREFNVLCVTKYEAGRADYHQPISGTAIMRSMAATFENGITFAYTTVEFQGQQFTLKGFRNGLSGTCLVIIIHVPTKHGDQEAWALYTDVPSPTPRPDRSETPERIQQYAKETIERRR